jgi:hypothetical protein
MIKDGEKYGPKHSTDTGVKYLNSDKDRIQYSA